MDNKYKTNRFLDEMFNKVSFTEDILACDDYHSFKQEKISQIADLFRLEEMDSLFSKELDFEEENRFMAGGVEVIKYTVKAIKDLLIPVYIIKPEKENGKSIMYLHGHDPKGVMGALTIPERKEPYHKNLPLKLAGEGFTVIAPELFGYGEAVYEYLVKGVETKGECFYSSAYLSICGFNLAALRVFQTKKVLDFADLLGFDTATVIGVSGGGMISEFIGIIDERIRNIIVASYTNTYKDSILGMEHCIDNYVPGVMAIGDSYKILALAVPKKLLSINGILDRAFPIGGSQKAFEYIRKVYERFHVSENFTDILFNGKHEICVEEVIKWLKSNV